MGLDMYFMEKHYLGLKKPNKEGTSCEYPTVKVEGYEDTRGEKHEEMAIENVKYVMKDFGYFRKANQIHGFIISRCCEEDEDYNCKDIPLSKEVILDLYNICKELLAIKGKKKFQKTAEEMLPCTQGFFFGSDEYDEYYKQDLEEYVKMVDRMDLEDDDIQYIYRCWY